MKKKTRYRLKPLDVIVFFICVGVFCIFMTLFWKDLNSSSTRTDINQIATISFKHKIAQRKFSDRIVWERLQQESPLYNNDTIRTADLADATISFIDGTVLELHENTMLQISYTEKGVKLNVGGGNVIVDTSQSDKAVEINMDNGSSINLSAGSKLSANTDSQSGEASFQIQSGSGSVKAEDGSNQIIGTGESVKISSGGQVRKGGITVTSISSEVKVLNFEEKAVPVHLEWVASEEFADKEIVVETSRSKDFSSIEEIYTALGSSELELPADDGTLYWRIYAKEEKEEPVEGKVRVENVDQISVLGPSDGAIYRYRKDLPQITFRWNGNEYVDHYKLEISENPIFSNLIFDQDISISNINLNRFEEGTYYWRVTPYYELNGIGYGETSAIRVFNVERKEKLNPPMLTVPVDGGEIIYSKENYNSLFMWKSEVKTADYQLLIASDSEFTNVLYKEQSIIPKFNGNFSTDVMPDGNYYWKVIRTSEEDEGSSESEIRSFKVSKYVPARSRLVYPPENFGIEEQKLKTVQFAWKLGDNYKDTKPETIVQFAKSIDFANAIEFMTEGTDLNNVKLSDFGKYYWRVGVLDEITKDFVYTEVRTVNILTELGSPVINYPIEDSLLVVDNVKPVKINWTAVPGADHYRVRVYDAAGTIIQDITDIKENNAQINLMCSPSVSKSTISVQALSEETEYSGLRVSKQSYVNVNLRMPSKVKLGAPENDTHIDGITAARNPVPLTWVAGEDRPEYSQFILRKVLPNGTVKIVETIENPEKTVYFERLSEGVYQWTVKATSKEGYALDAEFYKSFTVNPIPELKVPVLVEPSKNFVIGAAYLKKHRNIVFSWKPVDGANSYVFVLYQKTPEGLKKIYSEETSKDTLVRLKDLKILDVGDFEWQVTAYCYAADGYEEQHSKTAVGNFKIDFKKPKKIQTKDPGRLYAE